MPGVRRSSVARGAVKNPNKPDTDKNQNIVIANTPSKPNPVKKGKNTHNDDDAKSNGKEKSPAKPTKAPRGNGKVTKVVEKKAVSKKAVNIVEAGTSAGKEGKAEMEGMAAGTGARGSTTNGKARKREEETLPPAKRMKIAPVNHADAGFVLTVGEGDTGQLGLGPDIMDRTRPARVKVPADVVQVCAGGMHTVCVTSAGQVYTFGCNDEGALGRITADEDACMEPGLVTLAQKVVHVSAGDSHTAALCDTGDVYIWGAFRDSNGSIGMFGGQSKLETPAHLDLLPPDIVKIASGCDHLVCLTADGEIYTLGAAEQGQLGRIAEMFTSRGGRKGLDLLLKPHMVHFSKRTLRFSDVWTGQYVTYVKERTTGDIYAWGLNNYYQLGFNDMDTRFVPAKAVTFDRANNWVLISGGQHHTLALDAQGRVYSLGRKEYGRLGLGPVEGQEEKSAPTLIPGLSSRKCRSVTCGTAVSFAVDSDGLVYSWGMGSGKQLGHGDDEDDVYEPKPIGGKQLENKQCLMVSAGGQHTALLACDRTV